MNELNNRFLALFMNLRPERNKLTARFSSNFFFFFGFVLFRKFSRSFYSSIFGYFHESDT